LQLLRQAGEKKLAVGMIANHEICCVYPVLPVNRVFLQTFTVTDMIPRKELINIFILVFL